MRFKAFYEQTWKGFERQKMFPFMYDTDKGPWQRTPTHINDDIKDYGEMPYRPEAFYHVTRDLPFFGAESPYSETAPPQASDRRERDVGVAL